MTAIDSTWRKGGGSDGRVSPRPLISAASSRPVLVGSAAGWASRAWLEERLGGRIGSRGCAASGSRSPHACSYASGDGAVRELQGSYERALGQLWAVDVSDALSDAY